MTARAKKTVSTSPTAGGVLDSIIGPKGVAEAEAIDAALSDAPESVIDRLAKKTCACAVPSATGKCEHPTIEGEDVLDLLLSHDAKLLHGRTTSYWRFKAAPSNTAESELPQDDLRGTIARYADGMVRIWSPKQPASVSLVPVTNLKMMRLAAEV